MASNKYVRPIDGNMIRAMLIGLLIGFVTGVLLPYALYFASFGFNGANDGGVGTAYAIGMIFSIPICSGIGLIIGAIWGAYK